MTQTTTIAMLQAMQAGSKAGGFEFTIKSKKSCKQQLNKDYWHTIKICDKTGEMLVDVNVGKKYNPIAASSIRIVTCEVQDAELQNKPIKKLYTDEYSLPTHIGEPDIVDLNSSDLIIRGKIKCLLIARMFDSSTDKYLINNILNIAQNEKLGQIIDEIIKG